MNCVVNTSALYPGLHEALKIHERFCSILETRSGSGEEWKLKNFALFPGSRKPSRFKVTCCAKLLYIAGSLASPAAFRV